MGFAGGPLIKRVFISESDNVDGVGIDDLRFTVPEPATLSLMALSGLAMMRRKK